MAGLDLHIRWRYALALFAGHIAAGVEFAPFRRTDWTWDIAFQNNTILAGGIGIRRGDGGKQRHGIRMAGILKYLFSRTKLHQVAKIHNADTVGNVADNGQVVGDEHMSDSRSPSAPQAG